jgi:predicted AAA+ superfamily ATPase
LGIHAKIVGMDRLLKEYIQKDLVEKIVLLSGPRQSGKTTLSKVISNDFEYFNYDLAEDRLILNEKSWRKNCDLVIFDELHKMKNWKSWVKGIYDTWGPNPKILVTGSAKLDIYRKMGDSLAGRFFQFRLHPLDIKELKNELNSEEAFDRLMKFGGFPEPCLKGEEVFYNRWKRSHLDIILRQDLLDIEENMKNIKAIETLIELLRHRVGSPVSYNSLARDLQRDPKTIQRWIDILEELYVVFKITPYTKNIARSLLKEPKYYFYDTGQVIGNEAIKLENIVATALLKELHFVEDTFGYSTRLHYLRNKDGKELDFLIVINDIPGLMLEVKWGDDSPSKNFNYFSPYLHDIEKIQLVKNINREKSFPSGIHVLSAVNWLLNLDLLKVVPR